MTNSWFQSSGLGTKLESSLPHLSQEDDMTAKVGSANMFDKDDSSLPSTENKEDLVKSNNCQEDGVTGKTDSVCSSYLSYDSKSFVAGDMKHNMSQLSLMSTKRRQNKMLEARVGTRANEILQQYHERIDQLRAYILLLLYTAFMKLYSREKDQSPFLFLGKFAGAISLCFLSEVDVPKENFDYMHRSKPSLLNLLLSRKACLLFVYISAWNYACQTLFDLGDTVSKKTKIFIRHQKQRMKIQNGDNEVCNRSLSEMFDIDMKNIYAVMQERERKNHAFEMARHPVCLLENYDDTIELRGFTNDSFSILVSEMSELCPQENGINSLNHQFVHDKELQNSLHDQTCTVRLTDHIIYQKYLQDKELRTVLHDSSTTDECGILFTDHMKYLQNYLQSTKLNKSQEGLHRIQRKTFLPIKMRSYSKMSAESYQRKILNDPNVPVEWMSVSKDTIEFNDFLKKISLQHIQKEPKPQEKENSCIKKINSLPSRSSFLDFGLIDSFVKEKVLLRRQCYQKTLMTKGNFRISIQGENTKLIHTPSPLPALPSRKSKSIFRVFQIAGLQLRRLVHAIAQIFEKFFSLIKVLVQILELQVRRITNIVKERQIYSQKMSTLLIHAQLNDKPV